MTMAIGAAGDLRLTTNNATRVLIENSSASVAIGDSGSFGGGSLVLFINNATVNPSSNPMGGGIVYFDSGVLKIRDPSGAVTTLAPNLNVTLSALLRQSLGLGVVSTPTAAGTTTLTTSSTSVQVFTGTTTQTVTLPAANAFGSGVGVTFIIKNRSTGDVTINRAGSDTIDGGTSLVLTGGANASVTLVSNGASEWVVV